MVRATGDPDVPRQLLNAIWSFERNEFIKFPLVWRVDTQANKNILRRHTINFVAFGGNGESARAAQGVLENLKRRTFIMVMTELLPRIIPRKTLRSTSTLIMDENKEQQDGAKAARGQRTFHPHMKIQLCCFHFLNLKIKDPDNLGTDHIQPRVFDSILAALWSVATYCETRREALITFGCLRAYTRGVLSPDKFQKLKLFLASIAGKFPQWAFFRLLLHLNLSQRTSSAVEGDHSVTSRSTRGGWNLGKSSALHAIVDKGEKKNRIRKIERGLKLHKQLSRHHARVLQPLAQTDLERRQSVCPHLDVKFCESCSAIGCHWEVREPCTHKPNKPRLGPIFERVRIVIICRHSDGHYFLVCSCFLYQRTLRPCEHILAVKQGQVKLPEDVSFIWHLSYANMDIGDLEASPFKPTVDMGKLNGPGVTGVPEIQLRSAAEEMPADRNGVLAWLKQGGRSWIPESRPIWQLVTERAYLRETGNQSESAPDDDDIGMHKITYMLQHTQYSVYTYIYTNRNKYTYKYM